MELFRELDVVTIARSYLICLTHNSSHDRAHHSTYKPWKQEKETNIEVCFNEFAKDSKRIQSCPKAFGCCKTIQMIQCVCTNLVIEKFITTLRYRERP